MSYNSSEIITRFAKYAGLPQGTEPDGKKGRPRKRFPDGSHAQLYYRQDAQRRVVEIQSYGSHFPLARLVLTPAGERRLWVLNGDRWGGRGWSNTNAVNDMMREAAQKSGTPWVILPFSALSEAGIDPGTIRVTDMQPERWEWEEHSAARLEDVPDYHRKVRTWKDATGAVITPPRADDGTVASENADGSGWHVSRRSALDGWQAIPVPGPEYKPPLNFNCEEITPGADGRYHWHEQRHWLGESVFQASYETWDRTAWRSMSEKDQFFLSAFDENEPTPLYFLAQLPAGARPATVAQAREALKPPEVLAAEAAGVTVQRQGDVFAIPQCGAPTRLYPGPSQRSALVLGVNHRATEVRMADGRTYARGRLRHARVPSEHKAIVLGNGKTWHLLVRNTVPAFQQGGFTSVRAWSLGGRVD